jgi:ribonuclease BN (tRNA processing enzyme)
MRIKVLGCSGGVGPGLRTTSLLIDDEILIDAGTGVGDLSLEQMRKIGNIFLTHSHLDHVCGLAFIADNMFDNVDRPIQVHATSDTLRAIQQHIFNWTIWPDFSKLPNEEKPLIVFKTIEPGQKCDVEGRTLRPFEVQHTVPAIGYVVEGPRGVFAFSGDTWASANLLRFLNDLPKLDLLMVEVAFPDKEAELGERSRHFTPSLLASELTKLRHKPRLLLTHAKPGCEDTIVRECAELLKGWNYKHLKRGDVITI